MSFHTVESISWTHYTQFFLLLTILLEFKTLTPLRSVRLDWKRFHSREQAVSV